MTDDCDVVVVGGGIAGLAAGWALRDRDVLVLEASDRVGGRIRSEPRGRYWLNFGAHVFAGASSATGRLLEELGLEARPVPGILTAVAYPGQLVAGGRIETYPFRLPLRRGDRLALLRVGLRLRLAVARYARIARSRPGEPERVRQARVLAYDGDRPFSDFLGHLPTDVDALFRPTIERSSGEPEEVAAGYGVGYFHLVWDRAEGLSRNILGGPARLPEQIAAALGERVASGTPVDEVVQVADGVRVRAGSRELRARHAVLATPADVTRAIVRELPEETAQALAQITYGPYVVGGILTGEEAPMPWDGVYAAATPHRSFNMLFNMANVVRAGDTQREPGGSLMVYSGAQLGRQMLERSDDEVVDTYVRDLETLFPRAAGVVREVVVQRWPRGLPFPRPGRHRLQAVLQQPLGRISLAGDYLGTWYTETAISTGLAAAAAAREEL